MRLLLHYMPMAIILGATTFASLASAQLNQTNQTNQCLSGQADNANRACQELQQLYQDQVYFPQNASYTLEADGKISGSLQTLLLCCSYSCTMTDMMKSNMGPSCVEKSCLCLHSGNCGDPL